MYTHKSADFGGMHNRLFKTKLCEFVGRSHGCRLGDQCRHAHSRDELREVPADYDPDARRAWAKTTTSSGWEDWTTDRVDDPNPPPPTVYTEYDRQMQDFERAKRNRNEEAEVRRRSRSHPAASSSGDYQYDRQMQDFERAKRKKRKI